MTESTTEPVSKLNPYVAPNSPVIGENRSMFPSGNQGGSPVMSK